MLQNLLNDTRLLVKELEVVLFCIKRNPKLLPTSDEVTFVKIGGSIRSYYTINNAKVLISNQMIKKNQTVHSNNYTAVCFYRSSSTFEIYDSPIHIDDDSTDYQYEHPERFENEEWLFQMSTMCSPEDLKIMCLYSVLYYESGIDDMYVNTTLYPEVQKLLRQDPTTMEKMNAFYTRATSSCCPE